MLYVSVSETLGLPSQFTSKQASDEAMTLLGFGKDEVSAGGQPWWLGSCDPGKPIFMFDVENKKEVIREIQLARKADTNCLERKIFGEQASIENDISLATVCVATSGRNERQSTIGYNRPNPSLWTCQRVPNNQNNISDSV